MAYNCFVIVGLLDDPASIKGLDLIEAFREIYGFGEEGRIVSYGDTSLLENF